MKKIGRLLATLAILAWSQQALAASLYNPGVFPSSPLVSGNGVVATGPNSIKDSGAAGALGILPLSGAATATTAGTGYVPGELITLTGGTFTRAGKMAVASTQVVSATVNAGGSGGTNGTQTVTGTTGSGTKFQASVTVAGNAITAVLSITVAGAYTANPTDITQEPVTGASLSGAKLALVMGVLQNVVADPGLYSAAPASPVAQGSTSGSGTGATFTLSWGPWSTGVLGANLAQGGNLFLGGNSGSGSNVPGDLAGGVNSGTENTFIGDRAGGRATTGSENTALGHNAFGIGAGVDVTGSNNVALGTDAMRNVGASSTQSVAIGVNAGRVNNASNNIAIGFNTAVLMSTGAGNTIIGAGAMAAFTNANDNTAVGQTAGTNITGAQNVILGSKAANDATGGSAGNTVIIGYKAGFTLTSGGRNTIIGSDVASTTLKTGTGNILIGTSSAVDTAAAGTVSTLNIGNLLKGDLAKIHQSFGGSAPVVSACGTGSPSIDAAATDSSGRVTTGTVATTCTITFAQAYGTSNHCVVTSQSSVSGLAYSYTLSAITITAGVLGGDLLDYSCDGN